MTSPVIMEGEGPENLITGRCAPKRTLESSTSPADEKVVRMQMSMSKIPDVAECGGRVGCQDVLDVAITRIFSMRLYLHGSNGLSICCLDFHYYFSRVLHVK